MVDGGGAPREMLPRGLSPGWGEGSAESGAADRARPFPGRPRAHAGSGPSPLLWSVVGAMHPCCHRKARNRHGGGRCGRRRRATTGGRQGPARLGEWPAGAEAGGHQVDADARRWSWTAESAPSRLGDHPGPWYPESDHGPIAPDLPRWAMGADRREPTAPIVVGSGGHFHPLSPKRTARPLVGGVHTQVRGGRPTRHPARTCGPSRGEPRRAQKGPGLPVGRGGCLPLFSPKSTRPALPDRRPPFRPKVRGAGSDAAIPRHASSAPLPPPRDQADRAGRSGRAAPTGGRPLPPVVRRHRAQVPGRPAAGASAG